MEILLLLIPLSVLLVFAIGAAFWWSVASGQFDDLEGPGTGYSPTTTRATRFPPRSDEAETPRAGATA